MVPFCDPVGWVEALGPVLGPILAALSVVAYPVFLIYQSLLLASQFGQLNFTLDPAVGEAIAWVFLIVAAAAVLIVVVVGAVLLGLLIVLLVAVLRGLFEPAPVNEPWVPRRLGRPTPTG